MSTEIESILQSFERLSMPDKREVASEIIRRSLSLDLPPLSDDELVRIANELFVSLDQNEADDA
jgi:hypothetical protein